MLICEYSFLDVLCSWGHGLKNDYSNSSTGVATNPVTCAALYLCGVIVSTNMIKPSLLSWQAGRHKST